MVENNSKKLLQRLEIVPTVPSSMTDGLVKELTSKIRMEAKRLNTSGALASSLASEARRLNVSGALASSLASEARRLNTSGALASSLASEAKRLNVSTELASSLVATTSHLLKAAEEFEKQFRLPKSFETASLLPNIGMHLSQQAARLKQAIEVMNAPWLRIHDNLSSVTSLSKLQEMGHVLNTQPVFGKQLADNLRANLGDWRIKIDWPDDIFVDPLARTDFYIGRVF